MSELGDLLVECDLLFAERDAAADRAQVRRVQEANAERSLTIATLAEPALGGPSPRVLEVGIGYTFMTTTLRWKLGDAVELYAVEHPARSYLGREDFQRRIAEQGVTLEPVDVLADPLPWPELSFDAILFADVIEHLPPTQVPSVLDRLRARLAPGGRLVVSSTNLPAFYRIASLAFGNGLVLDPPHPLPLAGDTYGHIRLYGRADMEILLERSGLALLEWRYLNWEHVFMPSRTPAQRAARAAQRIAPRFRRHWSTSWVLAATPS